MNILTFDIEEWFHILDENEIFNKKNWNNLPRRLDSNMDRIFDLLDKKKQKATFFVLGCIAREFPHIIKKITSLGYEIGSHSYNHQLLYKMSRDQFKNDLNNSIDTIEDITGKKVRAYRAPGFSIKNNNLWVLEELIKKNIEIDCSIFPAKRSHGGLPSYKLSSESIIKINGSLIKELPINTFQFLGKRFVFSGGGYFRFFPYWFIKLLMTKSNYTMTYFHPRDFDVEQPKIDNLTLSKRFKSYYGINNAFLKLEKLIDDFEFIDLNEAINLINWNKVKIIEL